MATVHLDTRIKAIHIIEGGIVMMKPIMGSRAIQASMMYDGMNVVLFSTKDIQNRHAITQAEYIFIF